MTTMTTLPVELEAPMSAEPDPAEAAMASIASGLAWGAQFVTDFGTRPEGTPPLGPTSIPTSVRHSPESGCPHVDIGINGHGRVEDMRLWLDLLPPETEVMVCRNDSANPFVRMSAYVLYGENDALIRLHSHLYSDVEMAKLWKVMDPPELGNEVTVGRDVLNAVAEGDGLAEQDGEPPRGEDEEGEDGLVEVSP